MKQKNKKFIAGLLLPALMCGTLLVGCMPQQNKPEREITKLADLAGKKVASLTGSVFAPQLDTIVDGVEHLYMNDLTGQLEAVESGRAVAVLLDEPVARLAVAQRPGLTILDEQLITDSYGFAFRKGDPLAEKVSGVIEQFEADGTLTKLAEKWFSIDETAKTMPELTYKTDFDGSAGVLRYGCDTSVVPMSYIGAGGNPHGFDVELAKRIAWELNMTFEPIPSEMASLILMVSTGKSDMVGGCMSITEERAKSVDFSVPYYQGGMVAVTRKQKTSGAVPLESARVGVMTGSTGEIYMSQEYPNAKISSFDSYSDAVAALDGGKLDYVTGSYTSILNFVKANPSLVVLPDKLNDDANAIALKKGNTRLRDKIDGVLDQLRADGVLEEMEKRWFKTDNSPYQAVEIPRHETGEVLRVAISADREPICFVKDGQYVGFDWELTERIAYELGMRAEYQNMKFGGLISALQAGKADMVISNLTRTEERAENVEFTQTYFDNPQSLLTRKNMETVMVPWYQSFVENFEKTFITENRYLLILQGLGVTLLISICSAILGTLLGFAVCLMRRAKTRWMYLPAKLFVGVIQGTPIVVMLMILFYVIFGGVDLPPVLVAIIGFSINFAAYVSEMMRTGIDAVDKGQLEAASAIGFNKVQVFCKITLPQALRHMLPVFRGEFISMIKMTSVVGYIAIQDLTKMSDIIRSRTYEAFFPLITTALIYLAISYLVVFLISRLEFMVDPKHRKRIVKGVTSK